MLISEKIKIKIKRKRKEKDGGGPPAGIAFRGG
jgi:hypothetical protein